MILKCLNMKTFKKWHASIIITAGERTWRFFFKKKMFVVLADRAQYSINPEIHGCLETLLWPSEVLQGEGCVRRLSALPAYLADNKNIPEASWWVTLYTDRCEWKGRACLENKAGPLTTQNFLRQREPRTLGMRSPWQPRPSVAHTEHSGSFASTQLSGNAFCCFSRQRWARSAESTLLSSWGTVCIVFSSFLRADLRGPRTTPTLKSADAVILPSRKKCTRFFFLPVSLAATGCGQALVFIYRSSRWPTSPGPCGQPFPGDATRWLLSENLLSVSGTNCNFREIHPAVDDTVVSESMGLCWFCWYIVFSFSLWKDLPIPGKFPLLLSLLPACPPSPCLPLFVSMGN